jgi:hypothetical protein
MSPMKRSYPLHDLDSTEFEDLTCRICHHTLGTGTISFTAGKDGGRDARFNGTAQAFPSTASPAAGKFIIQAKHTSNPSASCSAAEFTKLLKLEVPKITTLATDGELEYYLLFTNRRLTPNAENGFKATVLAIKGVKDTWIIANDNIRQYLDEAPHIWKSMGFARNEPPFRFQPGDLNNVITAFHAAVQNGPSPFHSAGNFTFVDKKTKNTINKLTDEYYEYMKRESLPHFSRIKTFLEDPRNTDIKNLYHDAADELKQKIITYRKEFTTFDEVLTYVYDLIINNNPPLKGKKQLVRLFLHYMYFDCDIGDHAQTN